MQIENLPQTIQQCAQVAGLLWQKGWAERNGGNMVLRIGESDVRLLTLEPSGCVYPCGCSVPLLAGQYFYCKASGHRMRDLAISPLSYGCIIRISDDGMQYQVLGSGNLKPTSEITAHLLIHNQLVAENSPNKATLHSHPTTLVALSHIDSLCKDAELTRILHEMIPEARLFVPRGINIVPFLEPGSVELAEQTLQAIKGCDIVLWRKHGVLSTGPDMMEAFDNIDIMEKSAEIYWRYHTLI